MALNITFDNSANKNMAFINEYIPAEDLKRYNFAELNKRPTKGGGARDDWTIDREADIWLRKFYTQSDHTELDGGFTGVTGWDFYWKGALMFLELKELAAGGGHGKPRWEREKLLNINIPVELESNRDQIIKDLTDAFTVHAGIGVLGKPDYPYYLFTLEL